MVDISQYGLVLEGGGMRGVFTCGVIDYLLDHKIEFPYVIGVSAGAGNGLSYVSKQRGRGRAVNIDTYAEYRYMGLKQFLKRGSFIDMDFLFSEIPKRIIPYDYNSYFDTDQHFEMVATNCITGEASYLSEKENPDRLTMIARASSSLPFMCPITYVDDIPMLDGGIVDSIPIERAQKKGYKKSVVVLTRNKGYRKRDKQFKIPSFAYKKYPEMRLALANRNVLYNQQLALVEDLEDRGEIIVIRPQEPVDVGRLEKDISKLERLYEEGYRLAEKINEVI